MRNVLVTGATGFIGIEVSRQLSAQGLRPRLMVRRPVRGLMLRSLDAEIMQADIRSPESLRRILKGVDTVIHLGARAAFESYKKLYPSIVAGSQNLMKAAIEAGVETFVYGGSLMVYGNCIDPIDQETNPSPASGYGQAKLEAELQLQKMAMKAGVCFVSLRLPHVYGAHSLLFDQIRHGKVYFPGKGNNSFAMPNLVEKQAVGAVHMGQAQGDKTNAGFHCHLLRLQLRLQLRLAITGSGEGFVS